MNSDELVALIPVNRYTAEKRKWKMPFPSLFMRLQEKTKGRILDMDLGVQADKPDAISEDDWRRFTETKTHVAGEWVDYFIEI